ncbi:Planctomycete cytochrome C [Roseimaritima multifibrata]|uniref:Planctomycete cytochrome C n=1 Tax=Roseimaritima multifibrata TaxID=1930274 RepID=A0A517MK98_9BACT|nr:DUF1553 domain-containing protein [Roseimaritima multifibrata]QDS95321.1 Planctomycete cytochrome C [Roseimaritima multifibrata]
MSSYRRPQTTLLRIAFMATVCCFAGSFGQANDKVDFATQIAPLLEQNCLVCHSAGIDKGDLSLATAQSILDQGLIIPGDSDSSQLVDMITSIDGEPAQMPKEKPSLTADEVKLIRRWIDEGATWPTETILREPSKSDASWWSFQPLASAPALRSIDDFIDQSLAEKQLHRSPPADRRTLIRRLTFDLHGLPPSPEAVAKFENDERPDAYARLVDQLLASPRYGERYARHWLDLAHYADTHGFERDRRRDNAWRYRDYVIDAFNNDKPFPRFLQEQIAGDVLWPEEPEAIVATGFLAAGPWDYVGHVETKSPILRRAARTLDLDDMATQVMTATMAMTVNCARCHDHKLDPILQEEYYRLQAVFAGVQRKERLISQASADEHQTQRDLLLSQINKLDFEIGLLEDQGIDLADIVGGGNGFGAGTKRAGLDPRNANATSKDAGGLSEITPNQFAKSSLPFVDGLFIPDGNDGATPIPITSTGLTISGLPGTSGQAWDAVRNGPVASQHSTVLSDTDFAVSPHTLLGLHANAGITFDLQAIRHATKRVQQSEQESLRLTAKVGYFGAQGDYRADAYLYVDGKQVAHFSQLRREDGLQAIDLILPASAGFLTLISTDGQNGYSHDQIGFGDARLRSTVSVERSEQEQQKLSNLKTERQELASELKNLGSPPKFYGVESAAQVPAVHLLQRGDPETPVGEPLAPGGFAALAMLSPELGTAESTADERRVALADWITDPTNPLPPRVIVNRLWHWHFGQGIVNTPSDFGFGGGSPSHPELLDWLAVQLQRENGSLKAIHRLILNSDTYKQQSRFTSDDPAIAVDADNRFLWRQNAKRMEAEVIRDSILTITGKLNTERGGPGFEDFQYQDAYAPIYTYVTADTSPLWKRSIYRFVVRTTPNPFLSTLDCPDPANLTPTRLTTTTPLQSLSLYNNDFVLRQATYLAKRIQHQSADSRSQQITTAFQITLQRNPTADELATATEFLETKSLFAFCRVLLNSNEFLYVD